MEGEQQPAEKRKCDRNDPRRAPKEPKPDDDERVERHIGNDVPDRRETRDASSAKHPAEDSQRGVQQNHPTRDCSLVNHRSA